MSKRDPILAALGRNVRQRRDARELTQEKLAEKSGLDPTYISDIERGLRNPGIKNVAKLAKALGLTLQGSGRVRGKSKERGSPDPQQPRTQRKASDNSSARPALRRAAAQESRAPALREDVTPYRVGNGASASLGRTRPKPSNARRSASWTSSAASAGSVSPSRRRAGNASSPATGTNSASRPTPRTSARPRTATSTPWPIRTFRRSTFCAAVFPASSAGTTARSID